MKPDNEVLKYFMSRKLAQTQEAQCFSLRAGATGTDGQLRLTGAKGEEKAPESIDLCVMVFFKIILVLNVAEMLK